MASLVVDSGPRKGLVFDLSQDVVFLGRDPKCRDRKCRIVVDEALLGGPEKETKISRDHAVLRRIDGDYYLEDGDGQGKRSRNRTFVNGKEVPFGTRVRLQENDRISLCDFRFVFLEDDVAEFSVEASLDLADSTHTIESQPADKLKVLLEISNSLVATLDLDALLARMLENLFRLFPKADRGFILLKDETDTLVMRAFEARNEDLSGRRFSASIVDHCLEKMQAVLGNDLSAQFPDSESVCELPVRSLMCVPLRSQEGEALGAIQLDASAAKPRFRQDDLNLLVGVASQASIALSNARMHLQALVHQRRAQEMKNAKEVHRALLPRHLPEVPGYEFFAWYEPAQEIGGDYYDFIPLPNARLAVLLGDVAGKGVPAALVMAKFSVEARVCLETAPDLASAIRRLNALMTRADLGGRFVTLAAVVLDPAAHTATLVNAGHPPPLLVRAAGGTIEEATSLETTGLIIGIQEEVDYQERTVRLDAGDQLLLFSDGVLDARNAEDRSFKMHGIRTVLARAGKAPAETGDRLKQAVSLHESGSTRADDITLVCLGRIV